MAGVKFELKENDFEKVINAIIEFEGNSEKIINQYLEEEAKNKIIDSIINLIPVSASRKKHAKRSNPLDGKRRSNLTLTITSKNKYNYLYFPDQGEGTNKVAKEFMEKGIDNVYEDVVNSMLEKLQKKLEEI